VAVGAVAEEGVDEAGGFEGLMKRNGERELVRAFDVQKSRDERLGECVVKGTEVDGKLCQRWEG